MTSNVRITSAILTAIVILGGCGGEGEQSASRPSTDTDRIAAVPTLQHSKQDAIKTSDTDVHYPRHNGPSICEPAWKAGDKAVWIRFEDLTAMMRGKKKDGTPLLKMGFSEAHGTHRALIAVPLDNYEATGSTFGNPNKEMGYYTWSIKGYDLTFAPSTGGVQYHEPNVTIGSTPDQMNAAHLTWVPDMGVVHSSSADGKIKPLCSEKGGCLDATFAVDAGCVSAGWECENYANQQLWDFGDRKQKAIADSVVVEITVSEAAPLSIQLRKHKNDPEPKTINLKFASAGERALEIIVSSIPKPTHSKPNWRRMDHYRHLLDMLEQGSSKDVPTTTTDPPCKVADTAEKKPGPSSVWMTGPNVPRCAPAIFGYDE